MELKQHDGWNRLYNEIELQHRCERGRNTIGIYGYFSDMEYVYLVLEFAPGGSLRDVLLKEQQLTPQRSAQIIHHLCKTIRDCHQKFIIHRDIKPENLLCGGNDGPFKIADFGISYCIGSKKGKCKLGSHTLEYAAPEILTGEGHGMEVDVYAMGVLLYEMLTGKTPFSSTKVDEKEWEKETTIMILEGKINYWHGISENANDLIMEMLKKDPKERISLKIIEVIVSKGL